MPMPKHCTGCGAEIDWGFGGDFVECELCGNPVGPCCEHTAAGKHICEECAFERRIETE